MGIAMGKKPLPQFVEDAGSVALHSARWRLDRFELDESRRELSCGGEIITVEPKPLNLLMLLLRHPGQLVTKNDLIDALWTGRIVTESVLASCVAKLRQVLGDDEQSLIRTVHGYGYRLDGQVEMLESATATTAPPSVELNAGDHIPQRANWKLVRRLGRSGDVWLADHVKTHSPRVFKFANDLAGLSALKREVTIFRLLRQSLGNDADIVEIIDWNFDAPPWFIEAEYCSGGSLQDWLDAQGGPSAVAFERRIDLIAQIADTLAKIHALGVLHKDLKPANVLIVPDPQGVPAIRLGDFGSGRLLDETRLSALEITRMGFTQLLDNELGTGTPLYYAPEVIAGKPYTLQADIYALGVMLYQLCVGNLRRQLAPGWELDIDDEILREDIRQAAAGSWELRLADASVLAENLRNIETRRLSRIQEHAAQQKAEADAREAEQARARRFGVNIAIATLGIGLCVSSALYMDARSARRHAEAEASRAQAVSDFLNQDLLATITSGSQSLRTLTVKELLDAGAAEVDQRFPAAPSIAADIHAALGSSYLALEQGSESAQELDKALRFYTALGDPALAKALNVAAQLVHVRFSRGNLPYFIEQYAALAGEGEKILGPDHVAVVRLRESVAWGHFYLGDWARAATDMDALYSTLDATGHSAPNPRTRASVEAALGKFRLENAELDEALAHLRHALATLHQSGPDGDAAQFAVSLDLSRALIESRHLDEAEQVLTDAGQQIKQWTAPNSGAEITAQVYLGMLRHAQGRYDDAVSEFTAAIAKAAPAPGALDQTANIRRCLGESLVRLGRYAEAETVFRSAITIGERAYGTAHPLTQHIRLSLAELLQQTGRNEDLAVLLASPPGISFESLAQTHPLNLRLIRLRGSLLPYQQEGA